MRSFRKSPNPEVLQPSVSSSPQTGQSQTQSRRPGPLLIDVGRRPTAVLAAAALGGSFTNTQKNRALALRRC